jgi:hypothetical protein
MDGLVQVWGQSQVLMNNEMQLPISKKKIASTSWATTSS